MKVDLVDEATLATINGRYFGAQMLVGLRIDLVSSLHTPQQGLASARGSMVVQREGGGFSVQVDARSQAEAGSGLPEATPATASGAEQVSVQGIGQIAQIAGDRNRLSNLTRIGFVDSVDASGFNGQTQAASSAGPMTAQVTFLDGGVQLGVAGAGAGLQQRLDPAGGGIVQFGRIAGNDLTGSNSLQLQFVSAPVAPQLSQQLGLQQALESLRALPR
ncbi:hypothetical protein K4L06_06950 [Lysobacter sp. BMK333-48F3]|uniref:hypothetical protein n=1 Tax=Lysobacter sp. BMK333-48F3 TaxID=2867962 RepID=UPI001C8B1669|nr:hypothetical protein [Lysobacter sp. BMK333-48F3]MBX9401046.1 hypothetical protein [Lysobacter sp. BMK333-48F3]